MNEVEAVENDHLSQLFYQYLPVIRSVKAKYYLRLFDEDDWFQEGYISLYKAKQAFDPTLGVSFGSFFKRTFENNIKSHLRKQNAYKRQTEVLAISWENYSYYATNEWTGLYTVPDGEELFKRVVVVEALKEYLTDTATIHHQIIVKLLEGKEISQIACELQIPTRSIRYQVTKLKGRLNHLVS